MAIRSSRRKSNTLARHFAAHIAARHLGAHQHHKGHNNHRGHNNGGHNHHKKDKKEEQPEAPHQQQEEPPQQGGGCNTMCVNGDRCSISCQLGRAAHCGCSSMHRSAKAACYCR